MHLPFTAYVVINNIPICRIKYALYLFRGHTKKESMYESFQPDYEGATVFYENLPCQNGNELFVFNAEQYFMNKGVEYSIERDTDRVCFSTPKGLFTLDLRNGKPSAVSVYSIGNSFIKEFRDSLWTTKKVFGFPVCAIMDNANDGYFETHPSRFIVIIFQRI